MKTSETVGVGSKQITMALSCRGSLRGVELKNGLAGTVLSLNLKNA